MADNDAMMQVSVKGFATSMARRVQRERVRIAQYLDEQADVAAANVRDSEVAANLRALAETVRSGQYAGIVVGKFDEIQQPESVEEDDANDPLPPVRHGDDFEDGLALVDARRAAQALSQRHGGAFPSD